MSSSDLKFTLRSIVDKNKLNGTNFIDWERYLRIVLRSEGREDVLETPIPILIDASTNEEKATEKEIRAKSVTVTCLMLAAMEPGLQKSFERMDAHTIMANLKILFQEQAKIEKHETHKAVLEKNEIVNPTSSINVIEI